MVIKYNCDMISCFSAILDYFDSVNDKNQLGEEFSSALVEQRENLEELQSMATKYCSEISQFGNSDEIESDVTLYKVVKIHTFISHIEWHVSEISELKDKYMKLCANKREQENGE